MPIAAKAAEVPRFTFSALEEKKTRAAFGFYLLFLVSFFIHLPARLTVLGIIRFDLLLVMTILFLIQASGVKPLGKKDQASKYLMALFLYAIAVIPFARWPGTVLNSGIELFIKAAIFYFFTLKLVRTEKRLLIFIWVYIACNTFRILEPLYLNITTGYWGSATSLGWEKADRLSGSPYDIINSNGLAFVIASVLPFYHYLWGNGTKKQRLSYALLLPVLLYTMSLTLSRSGLLAVMIIYGSILLKSRRKGILLILAVVGVSVFLASLNPIQRDRYLSIIDFSAQSGASAEGRLEGVVEDFAVAMQRPLFGHGLGTSMEANYHARGIAQPSHNLWAETMQELGIFGLILLILYIKAVVENFAKANKYLRSSLSHKDFLVRCVMAMQVWMYMNLLFSLASYGLKSYEWYLFGGLSVVILGIAQAKVAEAASAEPQPQKKVGHYPLAIRRRSSGAQ